MQLYNPTKDTVRIQIEGTVYEVAGESSVSVSNKDHAHRWKNTHSFLQVVETPVKKEVVEPEVIEEETTEDTEIVEEESEEVSIANKLRKALDKKK